MASSIITVLRTEGELTAGGPHILLRMSDFRARYLAGSALVGITACTTYQYRSLLAGALESQRPATECTVPANGQGAFGANRED